MILSRAVFHPVVFAVGFLLERAIHAATFMTPGQAVRSLVAIPVAVLVLGWFVQRRLRDWHRTGALLALLLLLLLAYRVAVHLLKVHLPGQSEALSLGLLLPFAIAYALCATTSAWRMVRRPTTLTLYLNVTSLVFLGLQLVQLPGVVQPALGAMTAGAGRLALTAPVKPDIYVIVLDGYARDDVLREVYRYDNAPFLRELEARGFYVAREASSNYVQTSYAVAALLNFDYVRWWSYPSGYVDHLHQLIRHNRTFDLLKPLGYRTVAFDTGYAPIQIRDADVFLSPFVPLNDFEAILLVNSPVEVVSTRWDLPLPTLTHAAHRRRTGYVMDALGPIAAGIAGPKIVYAHVVAPHPPFVSDEHGHPVDPQRPFATRDASDWPGTRDEYWAGYARRVSFVNRKIVSAVDAILAASRTPPVIVVLGDHGPGSMFTWDPDKPGCLWERTSSLLAIRLASGEGQEALYPSISPVNLFRVVFNAHFGTSLPLLPDKTFLTSLYRPNVIIDVTSRRDAREACDLTGRPSAAR